MLTFRNNSGIIKSHSQRQHLSDFNFHDNTILSRTLSISLYCSLYTSFLDNVSIYCSFFIYPFFFDCHSISSWSNSIISSSDALENATYIFSKKSAVLVELYYQNSLVSQISINEYNFPVSPVLPPIVICIKSSILNNIPNQTHSFPQNYLYPNLMRTSFRNIRPML